jgi:hypothetical protein
MEPAAETIQPVKTVPEDGPPPEAPSPAPAQAPAPDERFQESALADEIPAEVLSQRICDFNLHIEGSPLEAIIERFRKELLQVGLTQIKPVFYLSDEWGVPEGTVAIGVPFYLADERLRKVQKIKGGWLPGIDAEDILRYLRHELGHVVNYAYRLHETEAWSVLFGPMARPYTDVFHATPFSPDFVRHLPGNYAQKHPDDDWAETLAVWMTPGSDWRQLYEDSPGALAKLDYCERTMRALRDQEPQVNTVVLEADVRELKLTIQEFYAVEVTASGLPVPRSLVGDLKAIFAAVEKPPEGVRLGSAATLLKRQKDNLYNTVYRWTSADPNAFEPLLDHLIKLAQELGLAYPLSARDDILRELTGFLTTLAMNHVYRGTFFAR